MENLRPDVKIGIAYLDPISAVHHGYLATSVKDIFHSKTCE